MKVLYTTEATATEGGRGVGRSATHDGKIAVRLSTPKEMGGDGGPGTNPEQLFATGYAACFLGAIHAAGRRNKIAVPNDATVKAAISFVDREDGVGFSIASTLTITIPGMDRAQAEDLVAKAHQICPYSHALTHVVDVTLVVA